MDPTNLTPVQSDVLRIARHLHKAWPGSRAGNSHMVHEKAQLRRRFTEKSLADLESIIWHAEEEQKQLMDEEARILQLVDQYNDYLVHEMKKGRLDGRVWYAVQLRSLTGRRNRCRLSIELARALIIQGKYADTPLAAHAAVSHPVTRAEDVNAKVSRATELPHSRDVTTGDNDDQAGLTNEQREILSIARSSYPRMPPAQQAGRKNEIIQSVRFRPLTEIEESIANAELSVRSFERLASTVLAEVEEKRHYLKDASGNWQPEALNEWVGRLHTYWCERERYLVLLAALGETIDNGEYVGAEVSRGSTEVEHTEVPSAVGAVLERSSARETSSHSPADPTSAKGISDKFRLISLTREERDDLADLIKRDVDALYDDPSQKFKNKRDAIRMLAETQPPEYGTLTRGKLLTFHQMRNYYYRMPKKS